MTNVQPRNALAYKGTALCGVCGLTRRYSRPRNHTYKDTVTWARETGDLKCAHCNKITTHALIVGLDWDEEYEALARGREATRDPAAQRRMQAIYRRHQPQNPRLMHIFSAAEGTRARADGSLVVVTYCGAETTIAAKKEDSRSLPWTESIAPEASDDDLSTFLTSWVRSDCPDCEFVHNRMVAEKQRQRLKVLMTSALCELIDNSQAGTYDAHVPDLIALLQRVHGEGGGQQ